MAETLCASPLIRGTEFILDDQGQRMFGCCGQRALASTASSALGHDVSTLGIYDSMRSHGWADPGGASTIGDLLNQAKLMNIPVASFVQYNEPWTGWLDWLTTQLEAGNPCVIELAYGQALVDAISGDGENAVGLRYHFIGVLGINSGGHSALTSKQLLPGFWCADGDSFAGNNDNAHGFDAMDVLQYYSDAVLSAARPCGGLALVGRKTKVAWTMQADGTGLDDQKHTCGKGFMGELAANGETSVDGLMSETYIESSLSMLPLANGDVYTWDGTTVKINQGAQVTVILMEQIAALKAAPAPVPPTPAPPAAPALSAQQEADLKVMADLRAALATA